MANLLPFSREKERSKPSKHSRRGEGQMGQGIFRTVFEVVLWAEVAAGHWPG
jgi:hypothetical protein